MTYFSSCSSVQVFRTNQSYDRWWEARKIWGGILNRVRDVVTQVCASCPQCLVYALVHHED